MRRKHIALIIVGLILLLAGFLYITDCEYAESKDNSWTVYMVKEPFRDWWFGYAFYHGNKSGDIGNINVSSEHNGKSYGYEIYSAERLRTMYIIDKFAVIFREPTKYYYHLCDMYYPLPDKVKWKIKWRENGEWQYTEVDIE